MVPAKWCSQLLSWEIGRWEDEKELSIPIINICSELIIIWKETALNQCILHCWLWSLSLGFGITGTKLQNIYSKY